MISFKIIKKRNILSGFKTKDIRAGEGISEPLSNILYNMLSD